MVELSSCGVISAHFLVSLTRFFSRGESCPGCFVFDRSTDSSTFWGSVAIDRSNASPKPMFSLRGGSSFLPLFVMRSGLCKSSGCRRTKRDRSFAAMIPISAVKAPSHFIHIFLQVLRRFPVMHADDLALSERPHTFDSLSVNEPAPRTYWPIEWRTERCRWSKLFPRFFLIRPNSMLVSFSNSSIPLRYRTSAKFPFWDEPARPRQGAKNLTKPAFLEISFFLRLTP